MNIVIEEGKRGDCDAYGVRGRSGMWMVKSSIVYGRGE